MYYKLLFLTVIFVFFGIFQARMFFPARMRTKQKTSSSHAMRVQRAMSTFTELLVKVEKQLCEMQPRSHCRN